MYGAVDKRRPVSGRSLIAPPCREGCRISISIHPKPSMPSRPLHDLPPTIEAHDRSSNPTGQQPGIDIIKVGTAGPLNPLKRVRFSPRLAVRDREVLLISIMHGAPLQIRVALPDAPGQGQRPGRITGQIIRQDTAPPRRHEKGLGKNGLENHRNFCSSNTK